MSQPSLPGTSTRRRHPSAGNLTGRPVLVTADEPGVLPPLVFPVGEPDDPALRLGPDLDEEHATRLVGQIDGKTVLELGCGSGANAIALARRGAKVIVVEPSLERLTRARRNAEDHATRIEFHHGDFADLAFIRAERVDLCIAAYSLATIDDVSRVFRQVHRVQCTEAPFLITLPHPSSYDCALDETATPRVVRAADDPAPVPWPDVAWPDEADVAHDLVPHRISDMFTALTRSNFRVDMLLEPMDARPTARLYRSPLERWVPATFLIRGRKQGI